VPILPNLVYLNLDIYSYNQKKSKNESDQEETTDAWGFEKPSTSGIPQKLKKEQKKSKNESDQEETTDAWGFAITTQ
jgi:hypothetical protein